MQLARVISNTVLGAAYLGTSLYATYRVADGIIVYGLRRARLASSSWSNAAAR